MAERCERCDGKRLPLSPDGDPIARGPMAVREAEELQRKVADWLKEHPYQYAVLPPWLHRDFIDLRNGIVTHRSGTRGELLFIEVGHKDGWKRFDLKRYKPETRERLLEAYYWSLTVFGTAFLEELPERLRIPSPRDIILAGDESLQYVATAVHPPIFDELFDLEDNAMDKLGVPDSADPAKTASEARTCPQCGAVLDQTTTPPSCPRCGTEPTERRAADALKED